MKGNTLLWAGLGAVTILLLYKLGQRAQDESLGTDDDANYLASEGAPGWAPVPAASAAPTWDDWMRAGGGVVVK